MATGERAIGVRAVILLLLAEQPLHGYDLHPRLINLIGSDYNPSGMYRALVRLEEEGLVTSSWVAGEGRGPPRRSYAITDKGREALDAYATDLKSAGRLIRAFLRRYSRL